MFLAGCHQKNLHARCGRLFWTLRNGITLDACLPIHPARSVVFIISASPNNTGVCWISLCWDGYVPYRMFGLMEKRYILRSLLLRLIAGGCSAEPEAACLVPIVWMNGGNCHNLHRRCSGIHRFRLPGSGWKSRRRCWLFLDGFWYHRWRRL